MQNDARTLGETFIPKTILRKTDLKNTNPLIQKNNFEKTHGNNYVQLDPPQVKFNGYQLNKLNTLSFKIINKAPIPQRFNILPPTQGNFTIKVSKKGSIPTGMYETVYVSFKASDFKYLYDVVKIHTQTQNFVVPLYAYPTIPNLTSILPKMIDFGFIQLHKTQSYFYHIRNPTPIQYGFQFLYKKECPEIMINPLGGVIPGNGEVVVEIAFIPARNVTYSAEVYFKIQQFDFQPIYMKIIGNGKEKQMGQTFKRLKSSKLMPLKQKQDDKQKQRMNQTQSFLNSKVKKQTLKSNIRKSSIKGPYPKLLNSTLKSKSILKANQTLQGQKSLTKQGKSSQNRLFKNRFDKVQELDKQKQIKFSQFLGDRAMTAQQLTFQQNISQQMSSFRLGLLRNQCQSRNNPQLSQSTSVQFNKFDRTSKKLSWDENRNDSLYERRVVLGRFVRAVSRVIQVSRMMKRLGKVKEFLSGCTDKQQVARKVEQSYQKSIDSHGENAFKGQIKFEFGRSSIQPSFFPLQFQEGAEKFSSKSFEPVGKTEFDDLTELTLIEAKQNQKMNYNEVSFPNDFVNLNLHSPALRFSGQQQYSVRSSSLPNMQPISAYAIMSKPLSIPSHHFLFQPSPPIRFIAYDPTDQKDPLFILSSSQPIQDQFQGWSKGQHQVLKSKLLRNAGTSYETFSNFNYSNRNDIGFYGSITRNLQDFIQKPERDDQLQEDDSDGERYEAPKTETTQEFLQKIQTAQELKDRRTKRVVDEDKKTRQKIQNNLYKDKLNQSSLYVAKIKDFNKWIEKDQNKLIF